MCHIIVICFILFYICLGFIRVTRGFLIAFTVVMGLATVIIAAVMFLTSKPLLLVAGVFSLVGGTCKTFYYCFMLLPYPCFVVISTLFLYLHKLQT